MAEFTGRETKELQAHVEEYGVSKIGEYVSSKLDDWRNVEIHFAVCGVSGSGKSTFINRIRGKEDFHPGAAEVDCNECTKEPKCYDHPNNPNIKFWDLPGITNPIYNGDLEMYCKSVPLDKYHTFLIFGRDRFTAGDLKLAEMIRSTGKKFFYIRGKIDDDVAAARRSRQHLFDKDATLNKIREKLSQDLIERGLLKDMKEIFLVSSHFPAEYQFDELTQAIVAVLPQRQQESFILTIDILSKNILKRKVEVLRKRIKYFATASALVAIVPIPGTSIVVDSTLIKTEINFYVSQLCLPDEGSSRFSRLSFKTQSAIKAFSMALGDVVQIGRLVAAYSAESVVEEFARYIPIIGGVVASSLSYGATYYFLWKWLGQLEEIALKVLEETFDNIGSH